MRKLIIILILCAINKVGICQTLQTVTTSGNTSSNAIRVTGEGNIGPSGSGELVLGLLTTPKTNDTRNFIGWKNNVNTITNGIAGTLLLQGRSDISDVSIDFATGLGTPALRMRVAGNGNVSIGSTSYTPDSRLLILGAGTTNSTSSLSVQNNSGAQSLKVFDNGYIGVGTSASPSEKLQVHDGNLLISSDNYAINTVMGTLKISHSAYPAAYAGIAGKTNGGGLDQLDLLFYTAYGSASEKMRIMSNSGFVGIGTSTPQAKLDVNGDIYSNGKIFIGTPDASTTTKIAPYSLAVNGSAIFTKAVVKLNSAWPDYVFTPDYKVPTLDSLESFINANGHLPEIPTAKDVKKNGIDLGENQAVLLKKIEELTLFTIEMNKQSEELRKTLNDQAKKNEVQSEKIVELEKKLKALEEHSDNQAIK
jgi:hypothetical protein